MKLKTIAQGFGAATVVLILRIVPQLSSYHLLVYQSVLPMQSVIFGILIDLGSGDFIGHSVIPLSGEA